MEELNKLTFNGEEYLPKKALLKWIREISDAINSFSDRGDPIRAQGANKVISLLLEKIEPPQERWKPSEQEKSALRTAIYDERHSPKVVAQLQNILKAFEGKESRKDWKPSEEQMAALLNIEGDLRAFQYDDKAKVIAELYEQLKRL